MSVIQSTCLLKYIPIHNDNMQMDLTDIIKAVKTNDAIKIKDR